MNFAVFFQKYGKHASVGILSKLYKKFFLRSNNAILKYLRDAGAVIGEGTTIQNVNILGSEPWMVEIGKNTYFSGVETKIFTHDGGIERLYYMGIAPERYDYFGRVRIGDNCFIGHNCIIMKHVTIGDNCVIGAGSIATKSIPSNCVACGVPAQVICSVAEYFEKNKQNFEPIICNVYQKRIYNENHSEQYEKIRKGKEL